MVNFCPRLAVPTDTQLLPSAKKVLVSKLPKGTPSFGDMNLNRINSLMTLLPTHWCNFKHSRSDFWKRRFFGE